MLYQGFTEAMSEPGTGQHQCRTRAARGSHQDLAQAALDRALVDLQTSTGLQRSPPGGVCIQPQRKAGTPPGADAPVIQALLGKFKWEDPYDFLGYIERPSKNLFLLIMMLVGSCSAYLVLGNYRVTWFHHVSFHEALIRIKNLIQ